MTRLKPFNPRKSVPIAKWQWFGNVGHFCCGKWCRFHLTTKIGKYLVSTVGEYIHPSHSGGNELKESEWVKNNWPGEDVGCGRKFETMVFETNGTCDCGCGLPYIVPNELDFAGYNTHAEATAGHMKMCRVWANK